MNYYDLLELSSEATKEEIKKQYHSLSKKYHPDKNNGEDTQFKKIKEAFDVLYDDEERKKYDIQLLFGDIQFTEEDKWDDAQLKLGICFQKIGNYSRARLEFEKLINHYPGSEYYKRAQQYLRQL